MDWLLLVGFCGFLFFFGLAYFGLVGADEPRYAQVTREMLARHDWITPTLGGKPWLEKPALYYWQTMLAYSVFGVSDWAARLPSAVDATLMVIAIYSFQGQTQDQPGPRKNVPMPVSSEALVRNHVMIQNESGRKTSHRRNRPACFASRAAKSIAAAISTVGASTAQTSKTIKKTISANTTAAKMRNRLARLRSHNPSASTLTLKYGMMTSARTTSVGISTPPTTGGK